MFTVELKYGLPRLSHRAGQMRANDIGNLLGDRVTVEFSPNSPIRDRITYRHR